jgi:hypothetical protein
MYRCKKEEDFKKIETMATFASRILSNIPEEAMNKDEDSEEEDKTIGKK